MILLLLILTTVSALEHYVSVRDVTSEPGLPEHILMDVIGSDDKITRLNLKENKRLNANAPMYEQTLHDKSSRRRLNAFDERQQDVKYYHDVQNRAAVSVTCEKTLDEPCKRTLEGFLTIGKDTYEIRPVTNLLVTRMLRGSHMNIHAVKKVLNNRNYPLRKIPSHRFEVKDYIDVKELKNKKQQENNYKRQQQTTYAVECVVVVDPYLWKKFYDGIMDSVDKTKDTKYQLRRHLTHVMNGVSLMYASIEDPELNIYVTISGFLYYDKDDASSPVPKGEDAPVRKGDTMLVNGERYLEGSVEWLQRTDPRENDNDHVMIFSGCQLFTKSADDPDLAGIAFTNGACGEYRLSVIQDASYYDVATTAAHELGHNLNAPHDGISGGNTCKPEDMYLMAPGTNRLKYGEKHTSNPWRFSPCSIKKFKEFFQSEYAACLRDHGDYFDKTEWDKHNEKLPGELYSLDKQCEMYEGSYSSLCPVKSGGIAETDEGICKELRCVDRDNYCASYIPARGSPCGDPSANKWCKYGDCVSRETKDSLDTENPVDNTDTVNPVDNTDTVNPGGNTGTDKECFESSASQYNGVVSVTQTGKECALWLDLQDYYYFYDDEFPDLSVEEAANYCRAPDGDEQPWCFYWSDKGEYEADYCDIQKC